MREIHYPNVANGEKFVWYLAQIWLELVTTFPEPYATSAKKTRVACSKTQWNTWWLQKADWLRNIQLKSIKKYCPTTIKTSLKPTMQINKLNENTFREKTKCQHENNETDGNEPESESQPNALTRQVIKMVLFRNEQTIRCQFLCAVWKELTCSVHKISHYSHFRKSRLID